MSRDRGEGEIKRWRKWREREREREREQRKEKTMGQQREGIWSGMNETKPRKLFFHRNEEVQKRGHSAVNRLQTSNQTFG